MDWLIGVDWEALFGVEVPLLETALRGSAMYLGILVVLRVVLRREVGMIALPDILLIVLLADAAQNGMADDYTSITDGLLLVGVIVFWNTALDRLAFRSALVGRLVNPPPLMLVRNGNLLRENLERESVSEEELWSQLRARGVEKLSEVKAARLESNGEITVIKSGPDDGSGRRQRRRI